MRKSNLFLITLVAAVSLLVSSCGNKKNDGRSLEQKREVYELPQEMIMTKADTDQVRNLVTTYLENLKHNNVDAAMDMLYFLSKDSTVTKLPKNLAATERRVIGSFAGMDYEIEKMVFHKDVDCEVKYYILMPNAKGNNKVGFIIRPVREKSKWYLTLADTQTDTVKSDIQN